MAGAPTEHCFFTQSAESASAIFSAGKLRVPTEAKLDACCWEARTRWENVCDIIDGMKILIFGAGGVGSVVGYFLARTGHEVTLLGRPWHLDAIQKNGLSVTGIWGDYRSKAFDLCTDAKELRGVKPGFDLIILTVKSFDTAKAVEEMVPILKEHTIVLSLQNGLGNIETILKKVPADQFLAGRVIFGVETQPGIAKVTVNADDVVIGSLPGATPKLSAVRLAHTLATSKIPARSVENILTFIWSKVIYNCALNAICTIYEMPYGKILENPETKAQMETVVRECYQVGLKKGINLEPKSPEDYLKLLIGTLIPKTAAHFPSMLQDIRKSKRTDIEALNGTIAKLGESLGIPTPANLHLAQEILKKSVNFVKK